MQATVVEDFLKIYHAQSRPRTRNEQERLLNKHFLKSHQEAPLNRLTVKDILAITDGLKELNAEPYPITKFNGPPGARPDNASSGCVERGRPGQPALASL